VDLSLFGPTLSILGPQAANYRFTGEKPRTGSCPARRRRNAYVTSDANGLRLDSTHDGAAHV
jgi:formyl-CoA transferase